MAIVTDLMTPFTTPMEIVTSCMDIVTDPLGIISTTNSLKPTFSTYLPQNLTFTPYIIAHFSYNILLTPPVHNSEVSNENIFSKNHNLFETARVL